MPAFDVIPEPILTCERCNSRNVHPEDASTFACSETGYRDDITVFACYGCGLVATEPHYEELTERDRAEAAGDDAYHAYAEMELF